MGRLKRRAEPSHQYELAAETSVGRAVNSSLRLLSAHVSAQHASLRWTERGTWELRDLQSKNGTYVNGQRIAPGTPVKLEPGAELGFGSLADPLVVVDVSPPRPMLVRVDGDAAPIFLSDTLIALPSLEEPTISLFLNENGVWNIDSKDRAGPLADGDLITIGAEHWRCCLPRSFDETEIIGGVSGVFALGESELWLDISKDEESVALSVRAHGRELALGQKACHYVLLTLARCRLGRDLPPTVSPEDGWISVSALLDLLRISEPRLNVDIFRIRQELKLAGVVNAVDIVERDAQHRRIRLGTSRVVLSKRDTAGDP